MAGLLPEHVEYPGTGSEIMQRIAVPMIRRHDLCDVADLNA